MSEEMFDKEKYLTSKYEDHMEDVIIKKYDGREDDIVLEVCEKDGRISDEYSVADAIIYSEDQRFAVYNYYSSADLLKELVDKKDVNNINKALDGIKENIVTDSSYCMPLWNLSETLNYLVDECPEQSGKVLDVIDTFCDSWNKTCPNERLLKTVEHIGNMGDADLAIRSVAMIKGFKYGNIVGGSNMFNEMGEVVDFDAKASIKNVLSAYDDDTKKFILNEASQMFNKKHDDDILAKKVELLASIKQNDGADSSNTGDSRTGKVSEEQKSAAKDRTEVAKKFMKGMRDINR